MLDDYPVQIKAAYDKMRKDGPISPYLKKPTPSNLRKHSLNLYRMKNALRDKGIICDFLEINLKEDNLESIIRDAPLKKFKTVQNFFNSKTEDPRDYTIEFIAWLIDFKQHEDKSEIGIEVLDDQTSPVPPSTIIIPIPFESKAQTDIENDFTRDKNDNDSSEPNDNINPEDASADKKDCEEPKQDIIKANESLTDQNDEKESSGVKTDEDSNQEKKGEIGKPDVTTNPPTPPPTTPKWKIVALILIVISVGGGGTYWFLKTDNNKAETNKNTTPTSLIAGINNCMYWTGDHYESISCDEKTKNVQNKIPFDYKEWKYLKKNTQPDTLTEADLSKTWYFKGKDEMEFFTASGRYPLDTIRILRPLTSYMYSKYMPKIKKMASLEQRLTMGNIALVAVSGAGSVLLIIAVVRRKKKKNQTSSLT